MTDDEVSVSRPFTDARTHETLIVLAMRFAGSTDAAGGWILAAMPTSLLLGAFSVAAPSEDARMAVFRSDGVRLAGSIVDKPVVVESALAKRLAMSEAIRVRDFRDGSERLVAVQHVPRVGLDVVMTRDLNVVLASWHVATRIALGGLILMLAVMAFFIFLVQRADQRRITTQRALQAQLARASKLESLGTLAGGVAHDFNSVLAAIVGFGEMAQDAAPVNSEQSRHLGRVLQAALRGKALVARILAFSRGGARSMAAFELQPIVNEVLSLLSVSLPTNVELTKELNVSGLLVSGDSTQAFEAVMNLCTNAINAAEHGGSVTARLGRVDIETPQILSHSQLPKGSYLALVVEDSGIGITGEDMEHLFEPFFTTRADRAGTGLGLAVVHGVISELGGAIDVHSMPTQGARFTLYFPEHKEPVDATAAGSIKVPRGAGQRLLVIDDEPLLVAMGADMLRGLGYEAIGYSDPRQALVELQANPDRFAAIITDEMMPGMSGTQLTQSLRQSAPHVPVLLITGYGGALFAARATAAGVTRILTKPLQRSELAGALADLVH